MVYWEATRFLENRLDATELETAPSWFDRVLRVYGTVWGVGFVVPAVLAGAFLVFDLLAPHEWPFPNPRPPFACAPRVLHPGAELTLRMSVPHGTQLTVFTPRGRSHVLIPYSNRNFRDIERLTLAVDTLTQVFSDPGVYALTVSFEGELSATQMCRVRYSESPNG